VSPREPASDATSRFSDRVDDYVKYRPSYPPAVIDAIESRAGLRAGARIADVGSGTGISTRPWLERGYEVFGVEPNDAMRAAAERLLGAYPGFHSVRGTAEATTLPDASMDLVVAAQAFHWFRPEQARAELRRITVPPFRVALVWNERLTQGAFLEAYERALLEHAIDYAKVDHRNIDAGAIERFFGGPSGPVPVDRIAFDNAQRFDREGFFGRALSSSYVPQQGHPKHEAMMAALGRVFDAHQQGGVVELRYRTVLYSGELR
jgi:SAM-dependent methyltransferase